VGDEDLSRQLYQRAFTPQLERLLVDALFETYSASKAASSQLFLPMEVPFGGGGVVRRGMLEKKVHDAVVGIGGLADPQLSYRLTRNGKRVPTSHYTLYRIDRAVFTISSVSQEAAQPRFARYRDGYKEGVIPKAAIPFDFSDDADQILVAEDAGAWFVLKHGKEPFDCGIPQFAHVASIDRAGRVVWFQNLFEAQMDRVEYWIGQREIEIKDDPALVQLKQYIRILKRKRA
jgi:hypothetical protein